MAKQDGKKLYDSLKDKDPKEAKKELDKMFLKKVVCFDWDGSKITAVADKVLVEKTYLVTFKVWYEEPKKKGESGGDPYKHSARLTPKLSEMKNIEFRSGKVKVGANEEFVVKA